jgi:hypothetical protein
MKRSWKFLLLLCIPIAFLLYLRGDFAYPVRGDYSDLVITHLPNAIFLRNSLLSGEIPLWSPLIFAGYPFAANPLSGLHYPFGWLALLFPLPFGFNLVTALHLAAAGLGMYLFVKSEGLSDWPALAAAMTFQAMPKIMAHYAAGHLTMIYAISLTPWLLWAERKRQDSRGINVWNLCPGIILALIVLADPRWAPYAALLWFAYALRLYIQQRKKNGAPGFVTWTGGLLLQGLVTAILSAPLWLPLLEYVPLSTRSLLTASERVGISLPAENLLGLFIPSMGGYAEWELYAGALPWLLLIFTLAVPQVRRQGCFWLGVLGVSVLVSLGESIPGVQALSNLPGFSLLRVPARSLFLTGLAFAVLTGYAIEYLMQNKVEQKPEPVFFMTPFIAFPLLIAAGMYFFLGGYYQPFLWAGLALLVGMIAILLIERRWLPVGICLPILLLVLVVEMTGMDASLMMRKASTDVFSQDEELMAFVSAPGDERYRVYSPSFSLPQYLTVSNGLELVDGIDPMQLSAYVEFFSRASGIPVEGYTVTLPPFADGKPEIDNAGYSPDAELLGLLNTRYVLSAFPLVSDGLEWITSIDDVQVYQNLKYRPRAWLEGPDGSLDEVEIVIYKANQVVLNTAGAGRLVLADVNYPGWQVTVDGQAAQIAPYLNILRSVELGEGKHQVIFTFQPISVYAGWGIALIGWLSILLISLKQGRQKEYGIA